MAPPPVAEQAAPLTLKPAPKDLLGPATRHLVNAHSWAQIRLLVDATVLCLASSAAVFAAPISAGKPSRWLAAAFPPLALAVLRARPSPDERLHHSPLDTAAHVLGVVSVCAVLTVAAGSIVGVAHPVGLALRLWLFGCVYLGVARMVLLSVRLQATRAQAVPTLILGAGLVGERLVNRLMGEPRYGLRPIGFLDSDPMPNENSGPTRMVPVLGGPEDLTQALANTGAKHVILAFSSEPDHVLVDKVAECQRLGVSVSLVPRLFESINGRAVLDHVGGLPLLSLHPTDPRGWEFAVKHAFDRSFALFSLIALAPLMALIAVAVRLSSPGPVLFCQRRVGRDGKSFELLKFRTMREPDGSHEFELPLGCAPGGVEGLDRRTTVGRFLREMSLDELPQLINVLRGDMSLVGPRPERPEFVERFAVEVNRYEDRHRVKSGITGWAQVNGLRGQTSIGDRVEWDNYYIQNWSLRLDLRIMALTVAEVLRLRGDHASDR
jgi:exopolysaccharide biosynthesis polyprenyl glycosylphosphotransferase